MTEKNNICYLTPNDMPDIHEGPEGCWNVGTRGASFHILPEIHNPTLGGYQNREDAEAIYDSIMNELEANGYRFLEEKN